MADDVLFPSNILWNNEAYFFVSVKVIAAFGQRKISGYALKFPYIVRLSGLDSQRHSLLRKLIARGPVICSVSSRRYHEKLQTFVELLLQQRWVITRIFFIQDGSPDTSMKTLFIQQFTEKKRC